MRKFKLKIGVDVDDILLSCNQYAVELTNKNGSFDPPLSIREVEWGRRGTRADAILRWYHDPEFFRTQPVLPGAREFIQKLVKKADVYLITAVDPSYMTIRAKRLLDEFPEIPKDHIIMGKCKYMINVDMLLDDGAHNILASPSAYPVLMRRPWNKHMTGGLAVNNFEEFFSLLDTVAGSYNEGAMKNGHKVVALVGPSGSGKTALRKAMEEYGLAQHVASYTTRPPRTGEDGADYRFVSRAEFLQLEESGYFLETTRYAGECYGSRREDIERTLKEQNAVMALDICGAIALKGQFPDRTLLVYVSRPKDILLKGILMRDCPDADKVERILSLSDEYKNEELCDLTVTNDGPIAEAMEQMRRILF